jgi:hypothetical protein
MQSPKRRVYKKVNSMDNVQESHYVNSTSSSQTFRFNIENIHLCIVGCMRADRPVTPFASHSAMYCRN